MIWINSVFLICFPLSSRRQTATDTTNPLRPPTHKMKIAPQAAVLRQALPRLSPRRDFFRPTNALPAPQACSKDTTPYLAASTKKTENNLFFLRITARPSFYSHTALFPETGGHASGLPAFFVPGRTSPLHNFALSRHIFAAVFPDGVRTADAPS